MNEIIWGYGLGGSSKKYFSKKHDVILFYSKSNTYYFDKPKVLATSIMMKGKMKGMLDYWTDIPSLNNMSKERTGYPTQKPLALLRRIIRASSKADYLVLDPFCGCATACIAAQDLGRQWVGIDISPKAVDLVKMRLRKELGLFSTPVHRIDIPERSDLGNLLPANSPKNKHWLYGEQSGHCAACNTHFEIRNLEVDHIIARSKGGTDHIANLQLLCGSCNRIKGNRGMEYLRSKLQLVS